MNDNLIKIAKSFLLKEQLDENINNIKKIVDTLKVGDLTNFGKVLEISSSSITFKAKDTPKTKIAFTQRKIGSSDYVLSKLLKLKSEGSCGDNKETDEMSEEVSMQQLRMLTDVGIIDNIGLLKVALSNLESGKELTAGQKTEVAKSFKNLLAVISGDTSLFNRVKTIAKKTAE